MERPWLLPLIALAGLVVMAAGFVGYVLDPGTAYIVVFAVGMVALVAAYALETLAGRMAKRVLEAIREEERRDGYVYHMVGGPSKDMAEIVDLTRR